MAEPLLASLARAGAGDREGARPDGRERTRRRALYVLVLIVLLFHINDFAGDGMGLSAMAVTMRVVDHGTFSLGEYSEGLVELSHHEGHFYGGMPPGQSLLALPLYAVLRPVLLPAGEALLPFMRSVPPAEGRSFTEPHMVRRMLLLLVYQALIAIPVAALGPLLLYDLAGRFVDRGSWRLSLAALMAVGSIWWAYGAGAGPRTMGAVLLMLPAWWVICRRPRLDGDRAGREAVALGLGVALAVTMRYDLLLVAAVVVVWFLLRVGRREALGLLLAMVLVGSLTALYHQQCFGDPLATPYHRKLLWASRITGEAASPVEGLPPVEHDGVRLPKHTGSVLNMRPRNIPSGLIGRPNALLAFTPALAVALVGPFIARRRMGAHGGLGWLALVAMLAGLAAVIVLPDPGYPGSVGPRYLLPALPWCLLLMAPAWAALPGLARGVLLAVSAVPSYLAAMFTTRLDAAWQLSLLRKYGLSTYVLSRAQEMELPVTPAASTAVCLVFWALTAWLTWRMLPLRARGAESEDRGRPAPARQPVGEGGEDRSA